MKVHVIGPNIPDPNSTIFHVHKENCADLKRGIYRRMLDVGPVYDYESIEELVDDIYSDIIAENDDTWENYVQEFTFFPCVKGMKDE